jgi:hypothetical protein
MNTRRHFLRRRSHFFLGASASRPSIRFTFFAFRYFLGEAPMTYLTRWRLQLGARASVDD